jgi:predicted PurR-regulated permease PerM
MHRPILSKANKTRKTIDSITIIVHFIFRVKEKKASLELNILTKINKNNYNVGSRNGILLTGLPSNFLFVFHFPFLFFFFLLSGREHAMRTSYHLDYQEEIHEQAKQDSITTKTFTYREKT